MFGSWTSAVAAVVLIAGCAGANPGPTPGSSPSPELVPGAARTPRAGELTPGRYFTPQNAWTPVTFAFEVATSGWIAQNGGQTISKNVDLSAREISWSVEIVDELFATPCGTDVGMPIGPKVDDLVVGLLTLPDLTVGEPGELTIGGRAGQLLELSVPAGLDIETCVPPIGVQVWLDAPGGKYLVVGDSHVTRVYAVDVEGSRFILNSNIAKTADPAELAEFEAIVESITFHP